MSITFETKTWEGDKYLVLRPENISEKIRRCYHKFDRRIIYINNVSDVSHACEMAERLVREEIIDKYVVVEDYADEALEFFGLNRESFGIGYYYSIAELVSIYLCDTEYLLHFSGDSMPSVRAPINWLSDGIKALDFAENVSVFNLTWNNKYDEAKSESFKEKETFYLGFGFSDQMYLIKTKDFKKQMYNFIHEDSNRYPAHGGDLFEKKVDSWMRKFVRLRATHKYGSYIHPMYEARDENI